MLYLRLPNYQTALQIFGENVLLTVLQPDARINTAPRNLSESAGEIQQLYSLQAKNFTGWDNQGGIQSQAGIIPEAT